LCGTAFPHRLQPVENVRQGLQQFLDDHRGPPDCRVWWIVCFQSTEGCKMIVNLLYFIYA
jgi:hypothetical protein